MKLALIPPYCMLDDIKDRDYQLLLPQHLKASPKYAAAYAGTSGYRILDNGMVEGEFFTLKELAELAIQYDVDEIVLPDVMASRYGTIRQADDASDFLSENYPSLNRMGVVQGTTKNELHECLHELAEMTCVETIGIPRWLLDHFGGDIRIELAEHAISYENVQVHFLGMSGNHPKEPWLIGKRFGLIQGNPIRGMDTSAPYVFGGQGKLLSDHATAHRSHNYFDTGALWFDEKACITNVKLLEMWLQTP